MLDEQVGRLNELRGRVDSDLIDTLIAAFGQCQSELKHKGPIEAVINSTEPEELGVGARNIYLLNREEAGYGGGAADYSGPRFFNPVINLLNRVWRIPVIGAMIRWPFIHAAIQGVNLAGFFKLPADVDADARDGWTFEGMSGYFQGVTTFAPNDASNNPEYGNNQIAIVNHGDTVTRRIYVRTIVAPGYSATGCYVLQQCDGTLTWTLTSDLIPTSTDTPLSHLTGENGITLDPGDTHDDGDGNPYDVAYWGNSSPTPGTNDIVGVVGCSDPFGLSFGPDMALHGAIPPVDIEAGTWSISFSCKPDTTSQIHVNLETDDAFLHIGVQPNRIRVHYIRSGKNHANILPWGPSVGGDGTSIDTATATISGECTWVTVRWDGELKMTVISATNSPGATSGAVALSTIRVPYNDGFTGHRTYIGSEASTPNMPDMVDKLWVWSDTSDAGGSYVDVTIDQIVTYPGAFNPNFPTYLYNNGSGRDYAELGDSVSYASGGEGDVQYAKGGALGSEGVFNYNESTNLLAVPEIAASGKIKAGGELEVDGALNHDGTHVGFRGVTPVVMPSAYTQTYATASRTVNPASQSAFTGIDNLQVGSVYAQVSELEQLRGDVLQLAQVLNAMIDDRQADGLAQ